MHAELKLLDEQVERMRLIVTQLLQYARPTEYAGYVEALDVNRVMDECLVLAGHLLAQTRIEVVKDCAATQRAGFNRQELQQVLLNLIINAIQVMPQGGRLTLRTRDWAPDGAACGVVLEVGDTGPGLSPDVLEHLFRPFFTTRNDGNGLGLWISLGLVERYGGTIDAGNAPGGGAVFRVRLLTEPQALRVVGGVHPQRAAAALLIEHVEALRLHAQEGVGEPGQAGVEARLRVGRDRIAQRARPGLAHGSRRIRAAASGWPPPRRRRRSGSASPRTGRRRGPRFPASSSSRASPSAARSVRSRASGFSFRKPLR